MKAEDVLEFTYTNHRPPAARPGTNTSRIRLWWNGKNLVYDRRFVSDDGSLSGPIEHTFDNTPGNMITADNVAKMIHWGCCGWAAGGHEIWQLRERVANFIANATD